MPSSTLLAVVALSVALVAVPAAEARSAVAGGGGAGATVAEGSAKKKGKAQGKKGRAGKGRAKKGGAKRRRCRKGYVLRTVKVKRKGRTVRVKRCRKRASKRNAKPPPTPKAPSPAPGGTSPPAPAPDPSAARAFVEGKLTDSRFTDCPAGCPIEFRYSHFPGGTFHRCQLNPIPQLSRTFVSTYSIRNAAVGGDGSWSFEAVVPEGGGESVYRWHVTAAGTATASYVEHGKPPTALPPMQHVAGAQPCPT